MHVKQHLHMLVKCSILSALVIGIAVTHAADTNTSGANVAAPASIFPPAIIENTQLTGSAAAPYPAFTEVRDPTEALRVRVPVAWNDIDMGAWRYQDLPAGAFIAASNNLAKFYAFQHAGVFFGASRALAKTNTPTNILETEARMLSNRCVPNGRFTYADAYYQGIYDRYTGCSSGNRVLYIAALESAGKDVMLVVRVVVTNDADLDAMAKIFQSVQLVGIPADDH